MRSKFTNYLLTASLLSLLSMGAAMAQETVIHLNQSEAMKAAKEKIEPEYPAMARQLHLQGAVQLLAHISESGTVEEVKALTGNVVLMNAAIAALKRWKFTPFTSDGKPARAIAEMSFDFKL